MKKVCLRALANALIVAAFLMPGVSRAAFLLDTGTPAGTGGPLLLSSAQSLAGEFSATAGQTITLLSAYLAPNSGNGNSFIFNLYSGNFLGVRSGQLDRIDSTTATFTGTGWNSASVNWTVPTTGDYWLAIAANGSGTVFDAPVETSTSTGTVPALGFASAGSSGEFNSMTSGIGLEVTAAVPEPGIYGSLAGFGLLAFSASTTMRRKLSSAI
jgi:hypothetical protein